MTPHPRELIHPGATLALTRRGSTTQKVHFRITGVAGEGSTAVCYEAEMLPESAECPPVRGRLKEYHPLWQESHRDPDGVLRLEGADGGRLAAYLRAYDTLERIKRENPYYAVLDNYIPAAETFFGAEGAAAYIWTRNDRQGRNFGDYLAEVRADPGRRAEEKLHHIVEAAATLAGCVQILHSAGLLHLDLKPDNLLIPYDGAMRLNTAALSMYDIDSIHTLKDGDAAVQGTPGFSAPELARSGGENRSDIYSIGAILFYGAVILPDHPEVTYYRDAYYDAIPAWVEQSALIVGSEANRSDAVRFLLTRVLQKCLARRPRNRYDCCEDLLEDLNHLRACLLPEAAGKAEIYDAAPKAEAAPVPLGALLQDMLYRSPLDRGVPAGETPRVLVLGAGTYGQKFMDLSLQTGPVQLVAAARDSELNRSVYLHYRPALTRFVSVNGCFEDEGHAPYARMWFEPIPALDPDDPAGCRAVLTELWTRHGGFHYAWIALGSDRLNGAAADVLQEWLPAEALHYAVEGEALPSAAGSPLQLRTAARPPVDPQLERMAWCTHLTWCDPKQLDMNREWEKFREPYNYESSLSFALSIPYKLRSMGITGDDPAVLAEEFVRRCPPGSPDFRRMAELEHRRWVMEKVTDGWRGLPEQDGQPNIALCLEWGRTHHRTQKLHCCLVHGGPETPLQEDPAHWKGDGAGLDPLDRMSVTLYRYFRQAAAQVRRTLLLQGEPETELQQLSLRVPRLAEPVNRYLHCLQTLAEGRGVGGDMDRCGEDVRRAAVSTPVQETAERLLGQIARRFFPVRESLRPKNYKNNDHKLIRSLPEILTRVLRPSVAMRLSADMVENIAAPSVLHPAKVTYCYEAAAGWPREVLAQRITDAADYLRRRCSAPEVELLLVGTPAACARYDGLTLPVACRKTAQAAAAEALRAGGTVLYIGDGADRLALRPAGIGWCRFDPVTQRFPAQEGCPWLQYVQGGAALTAEDAARLYGAVTPAAQPESDRGEPELWAMASKWTLEEWQQMCAGMAQAAAPAEWVLPIGGSPAESVHYLPRYAARTVERLLQRWKALGAVYDGSTLTGDTADCCRLELYGPPEADTLMEELLSDPARLAEPRYWEVSAEERQGTACAVVRYHSPELRDVPADGGVPELLNELARVRRITGLRRSGGRARFVCPSGGVRRLLTDPTALYHLQVGLEARRCSAFDDVMIGSAQGCSLLTRGFRTVWIAVGEQPLPVRGPLVHTLRVTNRNRKTIGPALRRIVEIEASMDLT